jgi:hypothetical protein
MAPTPKRSSTVPPPPPGGHSYNGLPPVDWYPEPGAPARTAAPASPIVPPPPVPPFATAPFRDAPQSIPPPPAAPGVRYCQQCGGAPALPVTFGRVTGLILWFKVTQAQAVACRSCGRSFGRAEQARTLATGWWGVFAFFVNLWWVVRNTISLARLGRLTEPVQRMRPALPAGRPVFLRAGILGAVVIVGLCAAAASGLDDPTWSEGTCIRVIPGSTDEVTPVDCGEPHVGRIVEIVDNAQLCPVHADSVVEVEGLDGIVCIDEQA